MNNRLYLVNVETRFKVFSHNSSSTSLTDMQRIFDDTDDLLTTNSVQRRNKLQLLLLLLSLFLLLVVVGKNVAILTPVKKLTVNVQTTHGHGGFFLRSFLCCFCVWFNVMVCSHVLGKSPISLHSQANNKKTEPNKAKEQDKTWHCMAGQYQAEDPCRTNILIICCEQCNRKQQKKASHRRDKEKNEKWKITEKQKQTKTKIWRRMMESETNTS